MDQAIMMVHGPIVKRRAWCVMLKLPTRSFLNLREFMHFID